MPPPPPPHVPGWTLLHHAASSGDPVAVRAAIAAKPDDLDAPDAIGRTPLLLAMAMGPAGVMAVHALLQAGAALVSIATVGVDDQRRRIARFAAAHPHQRARIAAAVWSVELGLRPKAMPPLTDADRTWAGRAVADVSPEVSVRILALLGAAAIP